MKQSPNGQDYAAMSRGKIERLLNENIQRQRQNPFYSEISTCARKQNEVLFAECEKRGYVYDSSTKYLTIFESKEHYESVMGRA